MAQFIILTERHSRKDVVVNVEHIVSIIDERKHVTNMKDWEWTHLDLTKGDVDVLETQEEILAKINE